MRKSLQKRIKVVAFALNKVSASRNPEGLTWLEWARAAKLSDKVEPTKDLYEAWQRGEDPADHKAE